jgi:UDP-glucose 4-epimerase
VILVIGGTGFIGRNLLLSLHASGLKAITASRIPNHVFLNAYMPSVEAISMCDLYAAPELVLPKCSAVIWLAGGAGPGQNAQEPWLEMGETVQPVVQMAHAVIEHQPHAHFVFLSSGGTVYGNPEVCPVHENVPLRPISAYGFGKVMSEQALSLLSETVGLRLSVLRPANPVGRWQTGDRQGLIAVILNAIDQNRPVIRLGEGTAVRDYFDVGDLCAAIIAVIDQPRKSIGATYNVGSGIGYSINEIIDLVGKVVGKRVEVEDRPARAQDVRNIVLDCTRIRSALGWHAETPLVDTIQALVTSRQFDQLP